MKYDRKSFPCIKIYYTKWKQASCRKQKVYNSCNSLHVYINNYYIGLLRKETNDNLRKFGNWKWK